jgi:PTH1 family peptidyl-tRNA hydrolase
VLDNFANEEKKDIEEVNNNIIKSLSILINKDLDLFSSKVNQKQ